MSSPKRFTRAFAAPFLRYFDNRFRELHEQLADRLEQLSRQQEQLSRQVETVNENLVNRVDEAHQRLAEHVEHVPRRVASEVAQHVDATQSQVRDDVVIMSELALVVERFAERFGLRADELTARIEALDATGDKATHSRGWREADEEIVELPFAYKVAAQLPVGSRVLVGANRQRLALSLASLGLEVTTFDRGELPVEYPNLHVVTGTVEEWGGPRSPFVTIFWLSVGDARGLEGVFERLRAWLEPGGELLLSVPGLDAERLAKLVPDWEALEVRRYARADAFVWEPDRGREEHGQEGSRPGITLVRLTPRS